MTAAESTTLPDRAPGRGSGIAIKVRDLWKSYGVLDAVWGINLEIRDGELWAEPFAIQDSSMLSVFAAADALVLRMPHAPAAGTGERIDVIVLD